MQPVQKKDNDFHKVVTHLILRQACVVVILENTANASNRYPSNVFRVAKVGGGGGGTTRPLPRDGGAEELRGDSTVGPHPKVWTIDRE